MIERGGKVELANRAIWSSGAYTTDFETGSMAILRWSIHGIWVANYAFDGACVRVQTAELSED